MTDRTDDVDLDRLDVGHVPQPDPDDCGDWWAAWTDIGGQG
ncbi:MAG TPA: hypothetical protein VGF55_31865 [Gemmataceae bacterium]|jgi:hypothetical protein